MNVCIQHRVATDTKVRIDEHITDNRDAVDVLHAGVLGAIRKAWLLKVTGLQRRTQIFFQGGGGAVIFCHV